MALSPEYVQIRAADRSRGLPTLTVRLGDGNIVQTGGLGGWEAIARPRHRPITNWRGPSDPLTLTLPLLFDGFREGWEGTTVEPDIRLLEKFGGLDRGDPEPPLLIIEGALPHDESRAPQNRWVLTAVEWGDSIRRRDGHRVRQAAIATFMVHEEDVRLSRARAPRRPKYRYVRVTASENTYEKIAKRELGTKRLGTRLARLNGGRSADVALPLRHKVKVPTGDLLASWKHDL